MIELPLSVELEIESDAEYEMEVDSSFEVGSSNIVTGTFVADNAHPWYDVQVPYSGNGYPVSIVIFPKGGILGNDAFNAAAKAMAMFSASKAEMSVPDYTGGTATKNIGCYGLVYKFSTYAGSASSTGRMYHDMDSSASIGTCFHFRSNKVFNVYTGSSVNYTFPSGVEYEYSIVYSE